MQNDPIVINQTYLQGLQTRYASLVDDIDRLYGKVYPYGALPGSHVDITKPFIFKLGGANFTEAQDVAGVVDATRAGVVARFKAARAEIYTLEYGIKFLLADSDAVEQLSTLSAEQFEYFMPKTAG